MAVIGAQMLHENVQRKNPSGSLSGLVSMQVYAMMGLVIGRCREPFGQNAVQQLSHYCERADSTNKIASNVEIGSMWRHLNWEKIKEI